MTVPRIPPDPVPPPRYLPICPTVRPYRCSVSTCRHHAWRAPTGCTLDVAAEGPHTLPEVADVLGVCKERVRQLEVVALRKARRSAERMGLSLAALLPAPELSWDDSMPEGYE